MKTWFAVAAVLGLAAPLAAQESQDQAERRAQRLKESLQLSEDQTSKVKDIYKKRDDEIRGVLTEDQKTRYDEMNQSFGNRGRGGPGGAPPGGGPPGGGFSGRGGGPPGRGSSFPSTDDLKAQLSLSDEQVNKINEIRDGIREEMRNFWRNRPEGGGDPRQQFEEFMQKARDNTTSKIREVLTDEQKTKFDEYLKNYQSQQETDRENRARSRADENLNHIMQELAIQNAQEAEAVKVLVKKVLDLASKLDTFAREARGKMDTASRNKELSEEAVGDTLKELRTAQRELEKELAAARKELLEVVTSRQELELLRHGVLK